MARRRIAIPRPTARNTAATPAPPPSSLARLASGTALSSQSKTVTTYPTTLFRRSRSVRSSSHVLPSSPGADRCPGSSISLGTSVADNAEIAPALLPRTGWRSVPCADGRAHLAVIAELPLCPAGRDAEGLRQVGRAFAFVHRPENECPHLSVALKAGRRVSPLCFTHHVGMAVVGCLDRRVAPSNRPSLFVGQLTEFIEEAFHSSSVAPLVETETQGRLVEAQEPDHRALPLCTGWVEARKRLLRARCCEVEPPGNGGTPHTMKVTPGGHQIERPSRRRRGSRV